MEKFNCVVVNTSYHLGGAETITFKQFMGLAAKGHKISFSALYAPGPFYEQNSQELPNVFANFMRGRKDIIGFYRFIKWLRTIKPDVLWFICQPATIFWVKLAAGILGVKCIAAVHNTIQPGELSRQHPYRWLLPLIDKVVFVGESSRNILLSGIKLRPERSAVIYNGLDLQLPPVPQDRDSLRLQFEIPKDAIVFGIVARLFPIKGVDIFIEAAHLCLQEMPALRFIVIGDGPDLAKIQSLLEQYQIGRQVSLLGHRNDIENLLPMFDVGVLSSRSEAMPISLLEYMQAGLPVIATDVGSVREIIDDNHNGLISPPENPQALAQIMLNLAKSPESRLALGRAGQKILCEKFSMETMLANTEILISSVIEFTKK